MLGTQIACFWMCGIKWDVWNCYILPHTAGLLLQSMVVKINIYIYISRDFNLSTLETWPSRWFIYDRSKSRDFNILKSTCSVYRYSRYVYLVVGTYICILIVKLIHFHSVTMWQTWMKSGHILPSYPPSILLPPVSI